MFRFLLWYGIFALTHLFVQISLSHREYLNQLSENSKKIYPSVGIVIPSYNEPVKDILNCVKSCLNQDYPKPIEVIVVDDGSKDKSVVYELKKIENKRLRVISCKKNMGKRHAQKIAFDLIDKKVDIIVTIDSDTILKKDAIFYLVQKFNDKKVGAITGNVRGKIKNVLSRLIDIRYWTAFNQERGSQSLFGTVLCCCGVLSAYRSNLIRKVKDKYIKQKFLGIKCTFGDDRYLTNLILDEGYKVKYEINSEAITSVPLKINNWLRQQCRWNKSFYRELLYSIKIVLKNPLKLHPYVIYDLVMQAFLPLCLIFALILMAYKSITVSILFFFGYLAVMTGVALIRGIYALFRTGEFKFLLFPFYAFLHVFLLIPVRIVALCTLRNTKWGTR